MPSPHSSACLHRWQPRLFPLLLGLQPLPVWQRGPDGLLPRRRGRGADGLRDAWRGCCGGSRGDGASQAPATRTACPGAASARYGPRNRAVGTLRVGDLASAHSSVAPSPGVQRPPVRLGAAQRPSSTRLRRHGGRSRAAGGTAPSADSAGRERRHVGGPVGGRRAPGKLRVAGRERDLQGARALELDRPAFKSAHAMY